MMSLAPIFLKNLNSLGFLKKFSETSAIEPRKPKQGIQASNRIPAGFDDPEVNPPGLRTGSITYSC
jgi:hypothetical protein